jgi:hypothetical protein
VLSRTSPIPLPITNGDADLCIKIRRHTCSHRHECESGIRANAFRSTVRVGANRGWHRLGHRAGRRLSEVHFGEAQVRGQFCVVDMSLTRALREEARPKSISEKGISAGHVRDTASAASYTGLEITLSTPSAESWCWAM